MNAKKQEPGHGARTAGRKQTGNGKGSSSVVMDVKDFTGTVFPGSRVQTGLGQATVQYQFLHQGKKYLMLSQSRDDYSELGEGSFWRLLLHDIETGVTVPASEIIQVR